MKVLSVDDSAIVRKIIRGAVEVLNYDFLEAGDGAEALEVLEKEWQETILILLDWNMPGMNGYECLVALKKHPEFQTIPVMMVTTESEKDNIVKAIQAGAAHYMTKPFTIEELIKKIMECLGIGE
ncbi:MAG TPA: response regulator [Firmicutes bacterium]|nr:response regulator [Bacillota bacterium]